MGIGFVVPAYRRNDDGKLQTWGEVRLEIVDDVELISVCVEDAYEGRSTNRVKLSELLEVLNLIMTQYDKRLDKATMSDAKLR